MNRDLNSPQTPLTSRSNKAVKYLASLSDPKVRKSEKAFLIEGSKTVEEALRDHAGVQQVVASPSLMLHHGRSIVGIAASNGIPVLWISERLMDQLSESKTPQPVMAVVEMGTPSERQLLDAEEKLIVLCHQLQDPGNLGTIIRTAEAAGASGVAVTPNTVDPFNAKCVRASMGSILRVPVARIASLPAFIATCKTSGFTITALTLAGGSPLFGLDLSGPTVIVVGQEGAGLPEEIVTQADRQIRIPMEGKVDSLNAAVSAAIVLYEAFRHRRESLP